MFGLRWSFGYDPTEAEEKIKQFELYISRLEGEVSEARERIQSLQAQIEEYEVRMAALRRERQTASAGPGTHRLPVTLMLGPAASFTSVAGMGDDLEAADCLSIRFRVFRDGFYRIDALAENQSSVVEWLENHPKTRDIEIDHETIHVVLK